MRQIINRVTELNKQELVSFLKQLKRDMCDYKSKLKYIKIFLNSLLTIFIGFLSYLVITSSSIYSILIVSSVTVLLLLPIYTYTYRYNKVSMIVEYIDHYISQLSHEEFTSTNKDYNINRVIAYLSRQFTINRYRLIECIQNRNTTELINMMKIA